MAGKLKFIFNTITGNLDLINDGLSFQEEKELQSEIIKSILIAVDYTGIEPETKVLTNETHVLYRELEN